MQYGGFNESLGISAVDPSASHRPTCCQNPRSSQMAERGNVSFVNCTAGSRSAALYVGGIANISSLFLADCRLVCTLVFCFRDLLSFVSRSVLKQAGTRPRRPSRSLVTLCCLVSWFLSRMRPTSTPAFRQTTCRLALHWQKLPDSCSVIARLERDVANQRAWGTVSGIRIQGVGTHIHGDGIL